MKKDAVIALIAIVLAAGICYGLAVVKLDLPPITPRPSAAAAAGEQVRGRVIMHVNGEPVTEEEFAAAYAQLPEEAQRQVAGPQGKAALAEQLVRYKILEQEARRLGVDRDPKVAGATAFDRTSILAAAAAQKLIAPPTDQAVRDFYAGNKGAFDSLDVAHILVAYAGGMAPPRQGNPPSEAQAMAKATAIVKQLRAGANFGQAAMQVSDDAATAERGGELGTFGRGALPPELEQRVFAMKEGEISDPMPSRFGIHIFRVGKRGTQPIEQVRPAIAQRMQQQKTLERIEDLRKLAKVDFDPKFFPEKAPRPPTKKSS